MTMRPPRPSSAGPPAALDPTGVRRLVAAAEAVTSMQGQRRAGYLHTPARIEVPEEDLHKLFYAIGAVRVAELERVVEAARGCVYQTDTRGPKVQMCIDRMRQALVALDAPAKEGTNG